MTKFQHSIKFITEILPKLPYKVRDSYRSYTISIYCKEISYSNGREELISIKGNCNLDAEIKMLKWLEENNIRIIEIKPYL